MAKEMKSLTEQLAASNLELVDVTKRLEQAEAGKSRSAYEWDAEREELVRERCASQKRVADLEKALADAGGREEALGQRCTERAEQLEQMRRVMDEQERELSAKIERVERYVKERQAGALHAERKQQDAERMAERWQSEVRRLQAERDKLAALVLDLEGRHTGRTDELRGVYEKHQQEVSALQEALSRKEEEMRTANIELLRQRDSEYQAKVSSERQREKDRSIALLKKKEQEVHIKDQQLKAARQRIQELESGATGGNFHSSSPSSRGSTTAGRRHLAGDSCLPPLPLSAR